MSLSILIPLKNEENIIDETIQNLFNSWLTNIDFELIIINDFCTDKTVEKINFFKKKYFNIKIINNSKPGLGSAINKGIENASKIFTTIYMADLSDDVNDLQTYYKLMSNQKEIDCIFGSRFLKQSKITNYPYIKLLLNRIANNLIKVIFFTKYNDFTNSFKMYKTSVLLELFPIVSENFNVFLEIPLKIISRKYNFIIIPISWTGRKKGVSKFNIRELTSKYIFTMLYCLLEKILLKK